MGSGACGNAARCPPLLNSKRCHEGEVVSSFSLFLHSGSYSVSNPAYSYILTNLLAFFSLGIFSQSPYFGPKYFTAQHSILMKVQYALTRSTKSVHRRKLEQYMVDFDFGVELRPLKSVYRRNVKVP